MTLRLLSVALVVAGLSAGPVFAQDAGDHQYSTADIEAGSRLYAGQCSLCHGPTGQGVDGIDLRRGRFRRSVSDEDLAGVIAKGIPDAGMPGFAFQPREVDGIIAFLRAGFDLSGTAVHVGNPTRGGGLFRGSAGCAACHRVNGVGPRTAPDLSDIGAIRSPAALQRAILDPTGTMLPINRPVRAVTTDGRTIRGRRLNEDTFTVQLIDDRERLVTLIKSDLREYEVSTTSPMPEAEGRLSTDDVADLIAYLLTLKGLE
jgi:putative heme-binding domain-containing protein